MFENQVINTFAGYRFSSSSIQLERETSDRVYSAGRTLCYEENIQKPHQWQTGNSVHRYIIHSLYMGVNLVTDKPIFSTHVEHKVATLLEVYYKGLLAYFSPFFLANLVAGAPDPYRHINVNLVFLVLRVGP